MMDPSCRPARDFFMFSDAYTVNLGLQARPAGGVGGGGTWVNCWVCATGLTEPLPHYRLFCDQL